MFRFIARRLLLFVPSLWVISVIAFVFSRAAPGDPVAILLNEKEVGRPQGVQALERQEQNYVQQKKELGLDRPVFYFSLSTACFPDTLQRITRMEQRSMARVLIGRFGNWPQISAYRDTLAKLNKAVFSVPEDSLNAEALIVLQEHSTQLLGLSDTARILPKLDTVRRYGASLASLKQVSALADAAALAYREILEKATPQKHLWPVLRWHGTNNQYHFWAANALRFDFGKAYSDRKPVAAKLWNGLRWTLTLNGLALVILYVSSIFLGVFSAAKNNSPAERLLSVMLFAIYAVPDFLIAVLLVLFLCNPQYLHWFPARGWPSDTSAPIGVYLYHITLPVFCLVYNSLAFVTRQVKSSMVAVMSEDYMRTGKAKGLQNRTLLWKHAFRNALLPLATLFGSHFPRIVVGAIATENIFSIPGIGNIFVKAIRDSDYPMISAGVMVSAAMILTGYLISDLLYMLADPRVRVDGRD